MKFQAMPDDNPYPNKISRLAFAAFAFILCGLKLWVISTYGNATPNWHQWKAEAMNLYRPLLDGRLDWNDLFATFTTRLLDPSLLAANDIWNPLLQMVVNAFLYVVAVVFGIALLTRVVGRKYLPALLLFSLFLFGIPFAWENTLDGFQLPF